MVYIYKLNNKFYTYFRHKVYLMLRHVFLKYKKAFLLPKIYVYEGVFRVLHIMKQYSITLK